MSGMADHRRGSREWRQRDGGRAGTTAYRKIVTQNRRRMVRMAAL